jgi:hypothetical protein
MTRINLPDSIEADPAWVGDYITFETGETYVIASCDYRSNRIEIRSMTLIEQLEWRFMKLKWWQIILVVLASMVAGGILTVGGILWYTNQIP